MRFLFDSSTLICNGSICEQIAMSLIDIKSNKPHFNEVVSLFQKIFGERIEISKNDSDNLFKLVSIMFDDYFEYLLPLLGTYLIDKCFLDYSHFVVVFIARYYLSKSLESNSIYIERIDSLSKKFFLEESESFKKSSLTYEKIIFDDFQIFDALLMALLYQSEEVLSKDLPIIHEINNNPPKDFFKSFLRVFWMKVFIGVGGFKHLNEEFWFFALYSQSISDESKIFLIKSLPDANMRDSIQNICNNYEFQPSPGFLSGLFKILIQNDFPLINYEYLVRKIFQESDTDCFIGFDWDKFPEGFVAKISNNRIREIGLPSKLIALAANSPNDFFSVETFFEAIKQISINESTLVVLMTINISNEKSVEVFRNLDLWTYLFSIVDNDSLYVMSNAMRSVYGQELNSICLKLYETNKPKYIDNFSKFTLDFSYDEKKMFLDDYIGMAFERSLSTIANDYDFVSCFSEERFINEIASPDPTDIGRTLGVYITMFRISLYYGYSSMNWTCFLPELSPQLEDSITTYLQSCLYETYFYMKPLDPQNPKELYIYYYVSLLLSRGCFNIETIDNKRKIIILFALSRISQDSSPLIVSYDNILSNFSASEVIDNSPIMLVSLYSIITAYSQSVRDISEFQGTFFFIMESLGLLFKSGTKIEFNRISELLLRVSQIFLYNIDHDNKIVKSIENVFQHYSSNILSLIYDNAIDLLQRRMSFCSIPTLFPVEEFNKFVDSKDDSTNVTLFLLLFYPHSDYRSIEFNEQSILFLLNNETLNSKNNIMNDLCLLKSDSFIQVLCSNNSISKTYLLQYICQHKWMKSEELIEFIPVNVFLNALDECVNEKIFECVVFESYKLLCMSVFNYVSRKAIMKSNILHKFIDNIHSPIIPTKWPFLFFQEDYCDRELVGEVLNELFVYYSRDYISYRADFQISIESQVIVSTVEKIYEHFIANKNDAFQCGLLFLTKLCPHIFPRFSRNSCSQIITDIYEYSNDYSKIWEKGKAPGLRSALLSLIRSVSMIENLMNCPEFRDILFNSLFPNILEFTLDKMFMVIAITTTLIHDDRFQIFIVAMLYKHKWFTIMFEIMNRLKSNESDFVPVFLEYIGLLSYVFLSSLKQYSQKMLSLITLINSVQSPFVMYSNYSIIVRNFLSYSSCPILNSYHDYINLKDYYRFSYAGYSSSTTDEVAKLKRNSDIIPISIRSRYCERQIEYIENLNICQTAYLMKFPSWVYSTISGKSKVVLPSNLYPWIKNLINDLKTRANVSDPDPIILYSETELKSVISILFSDCPTISNRLLLMFLGNSIDRFNDMLKSIGATLTPYHCFSLIKHIESQNMDIEPVFGSLLNHIQLFSDEKYLLLYKMTVLLTENNHETPMEIIPYILSMLTADDEFLVYKGLKLSALLNESQYEVVHPIIEDILFKCFDSFNTNSPNPIIHCIIEFAPSIAIMNKASFFNLLEKLRENYRIENLRLIGAIFDLFSPKNKKSRESFVLSTTNIDESYGVFEAPISMYSQDPQFWDLLKSYKSIFTEIYSTSDDETSLPIFSFIKDFPELLPFDIKINIIRSHEYQYESSSSSSFKVNKEASMISDSVSFLKKLDFDRAIGYLEVEFEGTDVSEGGGVIRSWFSYFSIEISKPENNYFVLCGTKQYLVINSNANTQNDIEIYECIGKFLALSMLQKMVIDLHLAPYIWKLIFNRPLSINDVSSVSPNVYNSLKWIMNTNNNPEELCLQFIVEDDDGSVHELIPNGSNISLNNANKQQYVESILDFYLRKGIIEQAKAINRGFESIITIGYLDILNVNEIDLFYNGIPDIDIEDMIKSFTFNYPLTETHPTVLNLFQILRNWSKEHIAHLLLFLTSSSKPPIGGFQELNKRGRAPSLSLITIDETEKDRLILPTALTCFSQLTVPEYNDDRLEKALLLAIYEAETF